jgi:arylsulfatase A-like enzyme
LETIGVAAEQTVSLGELSGGARVDGVRGPQGRGIRVQDAGLASASQPEPVTLEFWVPDPGYVVRNSAAYDTLVKADDAVVGKARIDYRGAAIEIEDRWSIDGAVLRLARRVRVSGDADGGFLSEITLGVQQRLAWPEVKWFAPGMIYGGFENLTVHAIGGRAYYHPGSYTVRIREDRLPAPLLAGYFRDGSTLAVLNPAPRGETTAAEGMTVRPGTVIDERLRFGSIGGQERDTGLALGYWFPGTEGEEMYQGNTYPGGQLHQWRRRYHSITDGLVQRYEVAFRFGRENSFASSIASAWRWAWQTLDPQVNPHDIDLVRQSIVKVLAGHVMEVEDRAGLPNALPSVPGRPPHPDPKTVMGFTGKALESAEFLLAEAGLDNAEEKAELRRLAEKVIQSFLRLKMSPPEAEGFEIKTGKLTTARGHRDLPEVYLRSFGDGFKALLRAYRREKNHGRVHPEWLAKAQEFADWLLTQQQPGGGFPRAWLPGTGTVHVDSPNSSYNAIALLVLLHDITGRADYLEAALRAGEFCWSNGQADGRFIGGTIDNPDVLDKEAGTISLEAYLLLYDATRDRKWLDRAEAAAGFAETWIYIWNVPMPADADNEALHWKRGVSTVGLQLIASGHSLVDAYMSFDADEYARLYKLTGDEHYLDVARILLHNTKAMVAIPGRTYDLIGPGWQQEHYSLAPRRGFGLHRLWLPWVSTSQLNGIFGLMELDPALFEQLKGIEPSNRPPEARTSERNAQPAAEVRERPNIVVILADDLGFSDLGCYGGEIHTPVLDQLAAGGLRFTQFYNTARCCPTRASLLTGLYPHQAGIGEMTGETQPATGRQDPKNRGSPGYLGRLSRRCVTIAEVLRAAGYDTLMTGKWHVGYLEPQLWPRRRGFDRYYGVLEGAANYFQPDHPRYARPFALDDKLITEFEPDYYTTDVFTDYAIRFMKESRSEGERPFFAYIAYNAPHWPLQAWPDDIARYRGKYRVGWDEIRRRRYQRQIDLGIIESRWALSPRGEGIESPTWRQYGGGPVPAWDSLSEAQQDEMDLRMAIYAAMVDRMDQNVGKIVDYLRQSGQLDNTFILFLSDNGGALGGGPLGFNRHEDVPPERWGGADSFISYGTGWANASNTPFRKLKCFTHEGGIATPLIAHWPSRIASPGSINREVGHVIDVMATCIDLAQCQYPKYYNGMEILPLEGKSLAPIFRGRQRDGHEAIFWEHTGNRAVRAGRWKLVSEYTQPWELYDLDADRIELDNLAAEMPDKVRQLEAMYEDYARRCYVQPWARIDAVRKAQAEQRAQSGGR